MKLNKQEQEVFGRIATFYIERSGGDYAKAIKDVEQIGFRRIEVFGDNVVVWAKRVGLFIGRRGENVDQLQKYLGKKIYIKEVEGDAEDSIVCEIAGQRDINRYDNI